jgi:hypothetical protein
MTSDELAKTVAKCDEAARLVGEPDRPSPDENAWVHTKMLAEIAFQLAVANERAAAPFEPWPPAYFEKDASKR